METIRTPEDRFTNLPGFPFKPNYVEINDARVHYIDEGKGEVILLLHGEPTWSYLYRHMISPLSKQFRVIAPDFIGFGRSDKYTQRGDYSFDMHMNTLKAFINSLELENITIVVQDWGGLIGLGVLADIQERFSRLVIMNTGLPTGEIPPSEGFLNWRKYAEKTPDLPIGKLIRRSLAPGNTLSKDVIAAYDAPFPSAEYKAGAQVWPLLVPMNIDDPGAAQMRKAKEVLKSWNKPALVAFSDSDPITHGGDRFFRKIIPTAKNEPEIIINNAGHFLQEEKGAEIADHIIAFANRNPLQLTMNV
ncbi:haloalkane dehalogenase [Paenisporosarcina sp. TG20]|uniref:haloalkane dehalogenase n=1 Tax=Paenisporosarcina sp. TG20 TaxID=1211706 RepID=UPI0002F7C1DA|nr:haloalkane dehalogenase [Paenisporosarcina sp. TG20]